MKKEGSSLALPALMDILPADFFMKYELSIVKALIYALDTLPELITVTAHMNCPLTINKLIDTCHAEPHFIVIKPRVIVPSPPFLECLKRIATATGADPVKLENDYVNDFKEICRKFTQELKSERKFARKVSRECLEHLQNKEHIPLEDLLNIDAVRYYKSIEDPNGTPSFSFH